MEGAVHVVIPVFDGVDLFDIAAPIEVLGQGTRGSPPLALRLVSLSGRLRFETEPRVVMEADSLLPDEGPCDVLLVPGGQGVDRVMLDPVARRWIARKAMGAGWVTSVCAGSLLLAAAGLLDEHCATTHWASLEVLRMFEKVDVMEGYPRVVECGNRLTSGGVTSALDLAMVLMAKLQGEQAGRDVELALQYDPEPPYGVGNPQLADPTTYRRMLERFAPMIERRRRVIEELLAATL